LGSTGSTAKGATPGTCLRSLRRALMNLRMIEVPSLLRERPDWHPLFRTRVGRRQPLTTR
jgi:hypothetical protein